MAETSTAAPTQPQTGNAKPDVNAPVDGKKTVDAQPKATDQKPPEGLTPAEKKAWKLAVNGKETELDISGIEFKDPALESKLKMLVQKGLGADEKFERSSKVEKMMEQFVYLLKNDPVKALTHPMFGHDMRKLSEEYLVKQLELEQMDPRDRKVKEYEERMKQIEEERQLKEAEESRLKNEKLREHYSKEYSNDILSTLKNSGLPQSPMTVKRMAHYMHQGLQQGVELKAADVIDIVRQDYMNDIKSLMGGLDEDNLLNLLGEDISTKVNNARMKKLKGVGNPVPVSEQPSVLNKSPKYRSTNDFEKLISQRI
jgi:hypothetical protein